MMWFWLAVLIGAVTVNFVPNRKINTNCARVYLALIIAVIAALIGMSGNNISAVFFILSAICFFVLHMHTSR